MRGTRSWRGGLGRLRNVGPVEQEAVHVVRVEAGESAPTEEQERAAQAARAQGKLVVRIREEQRPESESDQKPTA